MRPRHIGATSSTPVNPHDYDDPDYAYHSMSWHAARIESAERREQAQAAKIERRQAVAA